MTQDNTVILRVQLDESGTEKKLQQLVLDIEQTRKAQTALTLARKADKIGTEEYAKQVVDLALKLKGQRTEYAAQTKSLELYRTATGDLANTYKGTQAQLSLAQRQYQELENSQDNSTESTQALSKVIEELRTGLTKTDETQKLFIRNVGNYPKGENLEGLVRQLVELQEQTKNLTAGTDEAARAQMRIIGFQTQAAQAGAKEGKTFEETTNFIRQYGDAIRPATQELIKLTEQQEQLAASSDDVGEQTAQIGFRMGAAQKAIKDATDALKAEAEAADKAGDENQSLGEGLKEVAGQNTLVAATTEKYGAAKEKFTQATNLAKLAIGGEVTALGLLRLAIVATGLGALVLVLGSVVTFLTKTAEGTRLVENVMAQVGAVVNVLTDRFGMLGKAITQVFSGDFTGAANTAKAAVAGIGDEVQREVKLAGDLSKAQQQLNRDRQANADTNKRLLRDEENLKNIRDDESKSLAVRRKANEDAAAIEQKREAILVDLAQRQLNIYKQQVEARGGRNKADQELLGQLAEAENELADIQEDAAGRRNEYITNRNSLLKDGLDKEKEAEAVALDKRLALRKDALALEAQLIERQLQTAQVGSDKELSLLQQRLRNGYQAELNVKGLTVSVKKVIDYKYESESLALTLDFNRRKLIASLQAQSDLTAAALAGQRAGSEEALRLQAEQIEQQRVQALAGLQDNADNTAATARINAQAAQQQRDLEYQQVAKALQDDIANRERLLDNSYAAGLVREAEYQEKKSAIMKVGTDAQTAINAKYLQDNTANQQQADANERDAIQRHADQVKQLEQTKQDIRDTTVQAFAQGTDAIISLFGEESAAGEAAVAFKKVLALAEIGINLQKTLSLNAVAAASLGAIPLIGPALAAAYLTTHNALAIAQAAVGAATVLGFEQGGITHVGGGRIAEGPSHREGGIQLYNRGRHAGIEIEGGEPVLTRKVTDNPLLLSLASIVNQLAGGKPLAPRTHMAVGGVATTTVREQLRAATGPAIDYSRLAKALQGVNLSVSVRDTKAANVRDEFTQRNANV
jgi:hypothetical protein